MSVTLDEILQRARTEWTCEVPGLGDPEIDAMQVGVTLLERLDPEARVRLLDYLTARFGTAVDGS